MATETRKQRFTWDVVLDREVVGIAGTHELAVEIAARHVCDGVDIDRIDIRVAGVERLTSFILPCVCGRRCDQPGTIVEEG